MAPIDGNSTLDVLVTLTGDSSVAMNQDASLSDTTTAAQEVVALLVDRLLTHDVLSLTRMGQLKCDRAAALLEDPTLSHATPCHLAVKIHSLNVH